MRGNTLNFANFETLLPDFETRQTDVTQLSQMINLLRGKVMKLQDGAASQPVKIYFSLFVLTEVGGRWELTGSYAGFAFVNIFAIFFDFLQK